MKNDITEIILSGENVSAKSRGMSTRSLLASLGLSIVLFLVYILVFSFLRKRIRSVYEPRTYNVLSHMRLPAPPSGFLSWLPATLKASSSSILQTSGLDAYFFLRYILAMMLLCAFLAAPLLVVLIPIHATGSREGVSGLDKLSTQHISETQKARHAAHLTLCVLCTLGSLVLFKSELRRYFYMRSEHLQQHENSSRSAATLLVRGLAKDCQTEYDVRNLFAGVSDCLMNAPQKCPDGAIKKVWMIRDYSQLQTLARKRARVLNKLEELEVWLIERCLGIGEPAENQMRQNHNRDMIITGNLWREYLSPENLAEMHGARGSFLTWLKSELNRLNSQILQMQCDIQRFPTMNSCFIQFHSKLAAFIASRSLCMDPNMNFQTSIVDRVYPADVIWSNLSTYSWTQKLTRCGMTCVNYLIVFGWAMPVAALSMMTQTEILVQWMPQLEFLARIPKLTRLISSVVSPLMVSSLTSMVPLLFRQLAELKGFPTYTLVEMDVQKYLFLFMFFQLFLIVTLSTGLPGLLVKTLVNTSEGAITLANSLPKATTFFISYIVASCLSTAGNTLVQSYPLMTTLWYARTAKTPRQKFKTHCSYGTIYWGSVFPFVTNIGAIAITYALISPIILLSAIVGLAAVYVAFKYRILYCYVPSRVADGDYYPRAIFQLFAGLYCQQISLLGTLLVASQLYLSISAAALIAITVASHSLLEKQFLDMSTRLPLRRAEKDETGSPFPVPLVAHSCAQNSFAITSDEAPDANVPTPSSPSSICTLTEPAFAAGNMTAVLGCTRISNPGSPVQCMSDETSTSSSDSITSASSQEVWTRLFDNLGVNFSCLSPGQQSYIESQLFEHPDMRLQRPCVWLPNDWKGVAQDQVREMQTVFTDLRSSCSGCRIDAEGTIQLLKPPPDLDIHEVMTM